MASIQKITPNLWFDDKAEEAAKFYTSVFKNSKTGRITRYGKEGFEFHQQPEGAVMTIDFELEGQQFVALNGGSQFNFSEAISFIINCKDQEEVNYYWEKLTEGGDKKAQVCGWLKDKYGVSWQVVPSILTDMLLDEDTAKVQSVTRALLSMRKIEIHALEEAYNKG